MNSLILKNILKSSRHFLLKPAQVQGRFRLQLSVQRSLMINQYQQRFFTTQANDSEVIELVEGKVFEVLKSAAKCDHAKLSRTATFEDLGFDSLDGVELVLAMEEHFGFDLSNQDAEKITSVMDAIQIFHSYYTKRLQPAESGAGETKK